MAPRFKTTCRVCGQPRYAGCEQALCQTHWREYNRANLERSRANRAPAYDPEYRRLHEYHAEAVKQGASTAEAWRVAVAAEIAFQQHGAKPKPRWIGPFVKAELRYLRESAAVRAKLDAWQPVTGDRAAVPIDDGWEDEERIAS